MKNYESRAAYKKEYYDKNKEAKAAYQKKYDQTVKGKYTIYKRSAKIREKDFHLTVDEFATFWQKPCHYCGSSIDTIGLDRIDNDIGYQLDNIVSCCYICNIAKSDLSQEEYINHCKRVVYNLQ